MDKLPLRRAAGTPLLAAGLLLLGAAGAAAQQPDVDLPAWRPDPYRLISVSTGRSLDGGVVRLGAGDLTGTPIGALAVGVADRLTLEAGYTHVDNEFLDGEASVGARLQIGDDDAPWAVHGEAALPIGYRFERRVGDMELGVAGQWAAGRGALVAGAAWRGYYDPCEGEFCDEDDDWHGSFYGFGGGFLPLSEHVQLVGEFSTTLLSAGAGLGLRGGAGGLTMGISAGCGATALFGFGAECGGLRLDASYLIGG